MLDFYEELNDYSNWLKCPVCKNFPRIWSFNNGRFAKCFCDDDYGADRVRSESILSVYTRTGGTAEYNPDDLRKRWNRLIRTGKVQNKLRKGAW